MKKSLILLATAVLALVGCQKEVASGVADGDQTVTFSVVADNAATKAGEVATYIPTDINRCLAVVRMYDANNQLLPNIYAKPEVTIANDNSKAEFSVDLMGGQKYEITVWMDNVGEDYTVYNVSDDLTQIERVNKTLRNYATLDAFSASVTYTAGTTTPLIIAKRPFAQLNLITTDLVKNFEPSIKVQYTAPQYFNAVTGEVSAPYSYETTGTYEYAYASDSAQCTISSDYIFASDEKSLLSVKMTATKTGDFVRTFDNLPLQRNYKTNVIGKLLTVDAPFTVQVNADWAGTSNVQWQSAENIAAANALLAAAAGKDVNINVNVPDDAATVPVEFTPANSGSDIALTFGDHSEGTDLTITFTKNAAATVNPASVTVEAPAGTTLVFETETHVVINGTSYGVISGTFSANTLVINKGVTVGTLTILGGGLEIHGTVNEVTAIAEGAKVIVRDCEGLSESVYNRLKDFIDTANGYISKNETDGTYTIYRQAVAKVDEVEYFSIAEALSAEKKESKLEILNENVWPEATPVYYEGQFFATMTLAAKAAFKSNKDDIKIYCRPDAEVGTMSHVHVADNLTVFGNGASVVSGGDQDFEIDTYKYSRTTGNQDASGEYLTKDITLNIYGLNKIALWGQRNTENTVNLNLYNCKNVNRIYFSTAKGTINVNVENCSIDGDNGSSKNTSIKTDSKGTWTIKNSSFKNVAVAVALTNENGNGKVTVENCTFENVATKAIATSQSASDYASAIRVLGRSTAEVVVKGCTFASTVEPNIADIVIGEIRGNKAATSAVTYNVSKTVATVKVVEAHEKDATLNVDDYTLTVNDVLEGVNKAAIATQEEFVAACALAVNGDEIILGEGNFSTSGLPQINLTIKGSGAKTIMEMGSNADGSQGTGIFVGDLTLEAMTLKQNPVSTYTGFTGGRNLTFKNVIFDFGFSNWGNTDNCKITFNTCTFNQSNTAQYCVQELRGGNGNTFSFISCTFNSEGGRFINAYKQGGANTFIEIIVKDCTFKGTNQSKAALNLKSGSNGCSIDCYFLGKNTVDNVKIQHTATDSALFADEEGTCAKVYVGSSKDDAVLIWEKQAKTENYIQPESFDPES